MPFVSLALGLAGAAAVVAVSALLAQEPTCSRRCAIAASNSIVIYLAFFLPMAASRTVLLKTGWITDIGTISAIVTLAGVVGALILYWAVRAHAAALPVRAAGTVLDRAQEARMTAAGG